MNLELLWIDLLAITLIWLIFWAACIARLKRRWVRRLLMTVAVLVPSAGITAVVILSTLGKFCYHIEPNHFTFCASLAVAFGVCLIPLLHLAFKRIDAATPAAATWRPAPWFLALVAALSIGYMVLLNMDLAVRARCAIASLELRSDYLAMVPAITSEESNAAPLYDEAFAQLQADFEYEQQVHNPPTGDTRTFDPDEPATITYLNKVAPTLALLRQAASLPGCRFDADLRVQLVPLDKLLKSLTDSRNAANVLALDAYEANSHGDIARALDDVTAIFRMSRHMGQRPCLVSALIGIGQDSIGHSMLERTLPLVTSKEQLIHLHTDHLMPLSRIMRLGLISDESLGAVFYGDIVGVPLLKPLPGVEIFRPTGIQATLFRALLLDVDNYLDFMTEVEDDMTQPIYLGQQRATSLQDRAQHNFLTAIVAPSLNRLPKILGRGETNDSCGQIAIAMTRYRLDHGAWPADLATLIPNYIATIPADPFDGKPLRFITRGGLPILYSVDVDGVDHGGIDSTQNKGKGDWTYALEPATPQATTKP